MLIVIILSGYSCYYNCCYAECHYGECRGATVQSLFAKGEKKAFNGSTQYPRRECKNEVKIDSVKILQIFFTCKVLHSGRLWPYKC
jgi:hypothetical protein